MRPDPHYRLEDPTTGLPIRLGAERNRLATPRTATRFATRVAAILATDTIADQPHELVRVDA